MHSMFSCLFIFSANFFTFFVYIEKYIFFISISKLVCCLLLKSGPPGVFMAPGRTPYVTFINEFDFLLGCYSNVDVSLTCVDQSAQSSRNQFPPYRPVAQTQNEERRTKNEERIYLLDKTLSPLPSFEPGSAA